MDVDRSYLKAMLKACVSATNSLYEFMGNSICPVFKQNPEKSPFHSATMSTYNRIILWMSDLATVSDPNHFQLAATCVRSIFEHLLDLKWLITNPQEADKFFAFTNVRRFDIAAKILSECERNSNIDREIFKTELRLANDSRSKEIRDELCLRHKWIKKNGDVSKPKHWWGENIEQRTHAIDLDGSKEFQIYLKMYAFLSNHIHPGGVSLQGISANALAQLFVGFHLKAQEFCKEATEIVLSNFPVPPTVIEEFRKKFFGDSPYK
jgi:hypothetical protein